MLNETFKGEVTAVTTVKKKMKIKNAAGEIEKFDVIYNQVKIASADIDYESMSKFNANISATLLNIQPMPFESITFGEQTIKDWCVNLKLVTKTEDRSYEGIDFDKLQMKKIIVNVKENIPIFTLVLWIPVETNPNRKYLSEFFKQIVNFEFYVAKESV
jgi:hypothetical protein